MNAMSMNGLVMHFWTDYVPVLAFFLAFEAMPTTAQRARSIIGRGLSAFASMSSGQLENALVLALSRAEKTWTKLLYALAYALALGIALFLSDFLEVAYPHQTLLKVMFVCLTAYLLLFPIRLIRRKILRRQLEILLGETAQTVGDAPR